MTIKTFIQQEVLLPRLKKAGVMLVYDPDRRYHELCLELADEKRMVVDATESSIDSREQALLTRPEIVLRFIDATCIVGPWTFETHENWARRNCMNAASRPLRCSVRA